jgi:peroxiredoxin
MTTRTLTTSPTSTTLTRAATPDQLETAARTRWLDGWTAGPVEPESSGIAPGVLAPDLVLLDDTGTPRRLSDFWADRPALVMFWRHFGCACGAERARRLRAERAAYESAGLSLVVVAAGEPARAAAYRARHDLPCPVLCDPDHSAYHAYNLGHWVVERVLYDAPEEYLRHERDLGARFQADRAAAGAAPVDDPWRAVAEFVVGTNGRVRLPYLYQFCEDFPDPRLLTTAARLSGGRPPRRDSGMLAT